MQKGKKLGRPRRSVGDAQTAARILQCAAQLFMEHGYNEVSTEQVAEAADVTKAMVYYYFDSKANLLTAAMVRVMENIRVRTRELLGADASLYSRLLQVTNGHLRYAPLDFEGIMRRADAVLTDEQRIALQQAQEQLLETIADAFRFAMASGEIRAGDPWLCARVYMALLMAGRMERHRLGQVSRDETTTLSDAEQDMFRQRVYEISVSLMDLLWKGVGKVES